MAEQPHWEAATSPLDFRMSGRDAFRLHQIAANRLTLCGAAARFVEPLGFPEPRLGLDCNRIARTSSIECTSLVWRGLGMPANAA